MKLTVLEAGLLRLPAALPERAQRMLAGRPVEIDGNRLAPEVQLLLRLLARSGRPPFETLPVADARRQIDEEARMFAGRRLSLARVEGIHVSGGAGPRAARLYVPRDAGVGGPLLVYFHGGGWVVGSLASHDQTCRFLAREARMPVVSVDYRLAPESAFPAAVDDALAAFRWAVDHATELNCDPARVAIGGDSAGGNLSAVVAQVCTRLPGPAPAMQLLLYPVCDLSRKRDSYRKFRDGFFLTERQMDWYRAHYLPDEDAAHDPLASPLLATDLAGLAPAYIAAAGFDPLRDEALDYAERLRAHGVDVRLRLHEGLIHGFANAAGLGRVCPAAMREAAAALRTLHRATPPANGRS